MLVTDFRSSLLTDNEQRSHSQVNPIGQTQKRTATGKHGRSVIEAIKCIYHRWLSLYPSRANMRGQTRKPRFQQGNTNHVDVARVVSVRMHNRHRRALVGNAVDYICVIASTTNAQGTPEFPDERGWVTPSSSCRTCCLHRHSN